MSAKEATARIKINRLLEAAGWRFFAEGGQPANIRLEANVSITQTQLDALGDNFERTARGYTDFLLTDDKGFALVALEAKSEDKSPLVGKEQARKYARGHACRFVLLSNGNLHYFWDLERGNPYPITAFPTPDSVAGYRRVQPNPQRLVDEPVEGDYIALTQRPGYAQGARWQNPAERAAYTKAARLRFLRPYQLKAIHQLQAAAKAGSDRFLFEMATGTGKTLAAAAVIKLFLRTGNASRVLFLVDRLELEEQARKAFVAYLSADFQTVVYKEKRDEWRRAEIVVTTVQSLLVGNKYLKLFSPTDFDLVISDEAHRSIGGNARAVFDHFVGYKLGLTATPRDYLRRFDSAQPPTRDPREAERRLLLDTYRTFGCDSGQPTFRYSLIDGVKDGVLINPTVVDARTDVTTQLLSDEGFVISVADDTGDGTQEESFRQRDFERRFFSTATNQLFCKTLLEHGLRDPVSGEFGKAIVFAVSQHHAATLAQILNEMAHRVWPGRYQSDFAVHVTSQVPGAQQFTVNFANNNLLGSANFLPDYKSSKARVCVTVGMMTTGYDCPDILNLALMRPVFSPTDFIQIKGRGTRPHDFTEDLHDEARKAAVRAPRKTAFKLFDFFANCEFFEEHFNYDEVLRLPRPSAQAERAGEAEGGGPTQVDGYVYPGADLLHTLKVEQITAEGMRIDRMFFERFEDAVRADAEIAAAVEAGQWDRVIDHVNRQVFDQPDDFFSLDKLRRAAAVDRRLTLREILEKVFGLIPRFKSKDELLEEEFAKFVQDSAAEPPAPEAVAAVKTYFKAYASSGTVRDIIDQGDLIVLNTTPGFNMSDYRAVPPAFRRRVPDYIRDYVPLNQFAPG